MRALPALVTVAAVVVPLASGACYSVPALQQDAGHVSSSGADADAGRDGFGPSVDSSGGSSSGGSSGGHLDGSGAPDAACMGILCPCTNASECTTDVCAQPAAVGQAILTAANETGGTGFCTKACCSSADCPSGTVCWASGEGGQYCVDPSWLGRSKPTSNLSGGAPCNSSSDCLSGLCIGSVCADTCCSYVSSECVSPDANCVFGTFPGKQGIDNHFAAHCGPASGNTETGYPCGQNGDCQGGLCYDFGGQIGSACTQPCRAQQDCAAYQSGCQWVVQGSEVYAACFPLDSMQGSGDIGASCTGAMDCASFLCNANECTGPCFTDSDCTSKVSGWRCTPDTSMGSFSVLSCGP